MRKDLILVAIVVATLTLMVVPLSPAVIDVLLALNMSLSVLLLMVALYLRSPSDFSTLPSVILIGTAFRLSLSVGTTRLILTEAEAGHIIETFGEFVIAGSIAIGLVIFLIITVVQFLVVTKGAERVAEVGARFALDAMPGKQMSIDAELRAGTIEPEEASRMRRRLDRDSQFFGAMDGAMKFVKGDAIAGLIIICINLLGGVAVGMTVHGLAFGEAVRVFSLLTVGDGLVAQIPALLMSLCAGVIVTRVATHDNDDLGTDISKELVSDPRVPGVAAVVVLAMGFIPGFPLVVFAGIATLFMVSAALLRARLRRAEADGEASPQGWAVDGAGSPQGDADGAPPPGGRFRLVLGSGLASECDLGDLHARLARKFEELRAARGIRFPGVGVEVSDRKGARGATIEIDEVPVLSAAVPEGRVPVRGGADLAAILGAAEQDGTEGTPATFAWADLRGAWIPREEEERLKELGFEGIAIEGALAHLAFRLYERNLGTLFSHKVFAEVLAEARAVEPETVAEIEDKIERPALYRLLRYLVEDGVPVRPLPLLMSALHSWLHSGEATSSVALAECLRGSMKRQLCHRIAGPEGLLGVLLLDPALEAAIRRCVADVRRVSGGPGGGADDGLTLTPQLNEAILGQLRDVLAARDEGGLQPAILCPADLRRRLRNYLAAHGIHLPVLAPHELSQEITTYPLDRLRAPAAPRAEPAGRPSPPRHAAREPAPA